MLATLSTSAMSLVYTTIAALDALCFYSYLWDQCP